MLDKVSYLIRCLLNENLPFCSGLAGQPNQVLQQLAALQTASQQPTTTMQNSTSQSPICNALPANPSLAHHGLQQASIHDTSQATNTNAFPPGAPPPLNLFPSGTIPPNALTALFNAPQQPLPFQTVNNQIPANFPMPPWVHPVNGQTHSFGLQSQQQQRPLLGHPHMQEEQQMRLRQQQDFNSPIVNQFQQPYSSVNSRFSHQQRSKLREPYLRVKNLSRKYSYRDVKLLFADYKLRLEDIKMINDQNGERTGKTCLKFNVLYRNYFIV